MSAAWDPPTIASIVEGDGEVPALPKLLHRIAAELNAPNLLTPTPMRIPRGKITIAGGIERAVADAAFDLKMAREHSDSFGKLYREVSRLLGITAR